MGVYHKVGMPSYPHIERYCAEKQRLIQYGSSDNEQSIRRAFALCLDAEIQPKFNRGYPRDNIVFEDSLNPVLFQNGVEVMRADMSRPADLHRLIRAFLDHELHEIEEFRQAQQQFKADLPAVLYDLRQTVADAVANNAAYREGVAEFLDLCHRSIGPAVSDADVRETLLQHILTQDIFLRVFGEDQLHRENNIARQLAAL